MQRAGLLQQRAQQTLPAGEDREAARLQLSQLLSPTFPVGGFAWSQGLEYAMDAAWVTRATLPQWLADWLDHSFKAYPQKLVNVRVPDRARRKGWADCQPLSDLVQQAERSMADGGRVLVRARVGQKEDVSAGNRRKAFTLGEKTGRQGRSRVPGREEGVSQSVGPSAWPPGFRLAAAPVNRYRLADVVIASGLEDAEEGPRALLCLLEVEVQHVVEAD